MAPRAKASGRGERQAPGCAGHGPAPACCASRPASDRLPAPAAPSCVDLTSKGRRIASASASPADSTRARRRLAITVDHAWTALDDGRWCSRRAAASRRAAWPGSCGIHNENAALHVATLGHRQEPACGQCRDGGDAQSIKRIAKRPTSISGHS
jgi:hypothetical protein